MRVPQSNVAASRHPKTLHAKTCLSYYLHMPKSSRFVVIAFATSLLWCGLAASAWAQTNPPMPSQQRDNEKESLYAQLSEYRKSINPDQQKLAYPAAKYFLMK